MWEWLIPVLIVVAIVVIAGIYLWATYNSLVQLNVRVDEAWSDITVQLKRRADLLPNLIEAVKGYAAHEKAVFENVTRARAETLNVASPAEAGVAEGRDPPVRPGHARRAAGREGQAAHEARLGLLALQRRVTDRHHVGEDPARLALGAREARVPAGVDGHGDAEAGQGDAALGGGRREEDGVGGLVPERDHVVGDGRGQGDDQRPRGVPVAEHLVEEGGRAAPRSGRLLAKRFSHGTLAT